MIVAKCVEKNRKMSFVHANVEKSMAGTNGQRVRNGRTPEAVRHLPLAVVVPSWITVAEKVA